MNSTVKKIVFIIIILAAIGFIIVHQWRGDKENAAPNGTASSPEKIPVNAIVARSVSVDNELRSTGSLLANETVVLKSEVSGIVDNIYFKEGQHVKKGQLLVQLNSDHIKAEIEKLEFMKKLNEDTEARHKQLFEKEAISEEAYETAFTTLNTTRSDIRIRQVQLTRHQIRAPFDGVIGLRSVSAGAYLNPSDEIATLYSINPIKIDFSIPGRYSAEVKPGNKIKFTTEAYNETFPGKIYAAEPRIDPKTRTLKLRATSANRENKLLPGQFVNIQLILSTHDSTIMIPTEAVIPELNSKKVFVYKNGTAENQHIETGIRLPDKIQVTSGLSAGDTVIISGTLQLRQGVPVEIELQENE